MILQNLEQIYIKLMNSASRNFTAIISFFRKHKVKTILGVIFAGIVIRYLVTLFGHNFDMESYEIVGKIVTEGKNVYLETNRYNYGPIWSWIIGMFYNLGKLTTDPFLFLRYAVTTILTLTDLAITVIIGRKYGLRYALPFFINPISIIISGFHGQFDNIAILTALLSTIFISSGIKAKKGIGIFILGISLSIKHIFFVLPLWFALKEKRLISKLIVLCVPIIIFLIMFIPYWEKGGTAIIENVFLYKSFNNAPIWNLIVPDFIERYFSPLIFFIGGMILMGFILRKITHLKSFIFYTGAIFVFTSAVANQYLAIPVLFAIIFLNPFTALYLIWATIKLIFDGAGLNISILPDFVPTRIFSYAPLVFIFTAGFLIALYQNLKKKIKP